MAAFAKGSGKIQQQRGRKEVMMMRCVCCGMVIRKSARSDPYMCRGCEKLTRGSLWARYRYLDRGAGLG